MHFGRKLPLSIKSLSYYKSYMIYKQLIKMSQIHSVHIIIMSLENKKVTSVVLRPRIKKKKYIILIPRHQPAFFHFTTFYSSNMYLAINF